MERELNITNCKYIFTLSNISVFFRISLILLVKGLSKKVIEKKIKVFGENSDTYSETRLTAACNSRVYFALVRLKQTPTKWMELIYRALKLGKISKTGLLNS